MTNGDCYDGHMIPLLLCLKFEKEELLRQLITWAQKDTFGYHFPCIWLCALTLIEAFSAIGKPVKLDLKKHEF